jgi:tetratricopeptide (TPR) repeat protein
MAARGDVSGAIRAYDELITKRPDEASLRGELGNVYWSAGRLQDAAKSYHGAATVLIAARRIDEATRLEPVVRKGDAALADDLARRLAEAARAR